MSKKNINRIPPEEGSDRKAKADELKANYKELLKKYYEENAEARKTAVQKRKDRRDKAFDRFMEVQETFAGFLSEDPFILPFAPMYSIFPKKAVKQFMEIERLSNEYFKKQLDVYEDFRKQRKDMLSDMWKAAAVKNEKKDKAKATA